MVFQEKMAMTTKEFVKMIKAVKEGTVYQESEMEKPQRDHVRLL